jgi:hypothetical protein
MSLWIRRKEQAGRWSYLAVEGPVVFIMPVIGIIAVVLVVNLVAAPVATLLVCFSIAVTGSLLVGVAKWSMFRQGLFVLFGSAGMSGRMRAFYRIGWSLMILGTAITLLSVAIVLRH